MGRAGYFYLYGLSTVVKNSEVEIGKRAGVFVERQEIGVD